MFKFVVGIVAELDGAGQVEQRTDGVQATADRFIGIGGSGQDGVDFQEARRVRLFSDTGAWKQTALRVALFGPETPEYPITLLQSHPDALITATRDTATHPLSMHPEWDLGR